MSRHLLCVLCLGLMTSGCQRFSGQKIHVTFPENPAVVEGTPVYWNDFFFGEVRDSVPVGAGREVEVDILVFSKFKDQLDGRMLFYREFRGIHPDQELCINAFKCESRSADIPQDWQFVGFSSELAAQADCFLGQVEQILESGASMIDRLLQMAQDYWDSPQGRMYREQIRQLITEGQASQDWSDLDRLLQKIAQDMKSNGWEDEAQWLLEQRDVWIDEQQSEMN